MSFEEKFAGKDGRGADAAVERVLAGLRSVEVPQGIEQRVAAAMRLREAETVARSGVRGWVWAAAAAVVVAGVLVPVLWHGQRGEVAGKGPAAPVRGPVEVAADRPVEQRPVQVRGDKPAAVKHARAGVRVAAAEVAVKDFAVHEDVTVPVTTRAMDALARAEASAPSMPAPPEPLTEQERRLMRVALQGTAEQRAALNPVVRERQYEEAKKAVMEFFEPPKPPEPVQE